MRLAEGVLLVLDPEATPFTRIWCAFEEAMVADGELGLLLDIATVYEQAGPLEGRCAAVITDDGPTPKFEDEAAKKEWEKERYNRKLREQYQVAEENYGRYIDEDRCSGELRFPISVMRKGLEITVETAQASMEIDRVRILNSVAGKPVGNLDNPPPTRHVRFDEVNATLRGIFAAAAWGPAVRAGLAIHEGSELPLARVLKDDTKRKELHMTLKGAGEDDLALLVSSAPAALLVLELKLEESLLANVDGLRGLAGLAALQTLELVLGGCSHFISRLQQTFRTKDEFLAVLGR
jgi:hypothetical protein